MSEEQRARNRETLREVAEGLGRTRDKLATVVAQAGPLLREVDEMTDRLEGLLAQAAATPAAEPSAEEAFSEETEGGS